MATSAAPVPSGESLQIVRADGSSTRGQCLVGRMRGSGTAKDTEGMSTDDLMALLRGE